MTDDPRQAAHDAWQALYDALDDAYWGATDDASRAAILSSKDDASRVLDSLNAADVASRTGNLELAAEEIGNAKARLEILKSDVDSLVSDVGSAVKLGGLVDAALAAAKKLAAS